jgi:predicted benzoate:H+ symporter BenE
MTSANVDYATHLPIGDVLPVPEQATNAIWLAPSSASTRGHGTILSDLRPAAVTAGITTFIWNAFRLLPLQLEIAGQMNLSAAEASSAIFIVWFVGSVTSVLLCLYYRMPIPIAWTMPGLVYLSTLGGQFSLGQIAMANLIAGVTILLLGHWRSGAASLSANAP